MDIHTDIKEQVDACITDINNRFSTTDGDFDYCIPWIKATDPSDARNEILKILVHDGYVKDGAVGFGRNGIRGKFNLKRIQDKAEELEK